MQDGLCLAAVDGGGKSLVLSEEELHGDALEKRDAQEESSIRRVSLTRSEC